VVSDTTLRGLACTIMRRYLGNFYGFKYTIHTQDRGISTY
jgi:hypothetical protein